MKISIITINYNNAVGLKKTLLSVAEQTNKSFEYIVVDGNSTDNSTQIIEEFSQIITHCISEPDTGIYNAMNKGIKIATGDYCLFLNSGDYLFNKDVIKNLMSLSLKPDSIYFTDVQFEKNGKKTGKLSYNVRADVFFFASKYTLNHQNSLIARSLFKKFGNYNESLKIQSDWYFYLQVALFSNTPFTYLKDLYISIYEETGLSAQDKNKEKIEKETIKCIKETFGNASTKIFYLYKIKKSKNPIFLKLYKIYLKIYLIILKKGKTCLK